MREVERYARQNCDEEGCQDLSKQLNGEQILGRNKLAKRVAKGGISITQSDKGKGIVVMPLPMYQKMVRSHTSKDKMVSWDNLEEAQKQIRSNARALNKIFKIGINNGDRNQARCHDNASSWACDPPILRATAKTHKKTDDEGVPKSRPIVGAARGLTTPLGETLSDPSPSPLQTLHSRRVHLSAQPQTSFDAEKL